MKKKNITRFFLFCLLVVPLLLFSTDTSKENDICKLNDSEELFGDFNEEILKIPEDAGAYTEARIHVNNNWSATNITYDWCNYQNGFYIIENVTIDADDSGSAILINNTIDYFIIRNCTTIEAGSGFDAGIKLIDVENGIITNNNCSENTYAGIRLDDCKNITITNNDFIDNQFNGIYAWNGCYNITVFNNTFDNSERLIYTEYVFESTISNNTFGGASSNEGVHLRSSDDIIVANNTFNDLYAAMILWACDNPVVSANEMIQCGIDFQSTSSSEAASASIYLNNTVDGKAVYYFGGKSNLDTADFTTNGDPGQIILGDCHCFRLYYI